MKILAAIPLSYSSDGQFWQRDLGLVVLALRKLGHDAQFVALGTHHVDTKSRPLTLGTREQMGSASWWKSQRADAVIINTWSAPRYDDIRKAVLSATGCVIEKLDTDGIRSPRVWPWKYSYVTLGSYLDSPHVWKRILAPIFTLLRFGVVRAFPRMLDQKMALTMMQVPVLAAESPIAAERMKRFLRLFAKQIPRVVCIPHPVAVDYIRYDAHVAREDRIVSVGRWQSFQKNFGMLVKVLKKFLSIHPAWSADIVGELPKGWNPRDALLPGTMQNRLRFHGRLSHQEIGTLYQKARIFFMSSRYESFNIAAAEALCCGCSVVGSVEIASVPYFAGHASGTVVCRQSPNHFLDALNVEVSEWENDRRDAQAISGYWLHEVGAEGVAKQCLKVFETI